MARLTVLDKIRTLDPLSQHQRIIFLSTCYDFPFDTTRSLELALFRTFCVPSIAALLDRTAEFQHRAQKRYDDTDIIVSQIIEWGYDSRRGRRAIRRLNQLHGRFDIANDDFLYVLSTFIYEPIRWNARYGWRTMCEQEKLAFFHFWRAVGRRMGIRNMPDDFAAFERFNLDYERRFECTPGSQRIGSAVREMFARWVPTPLRPAVRAAIHAALDPPVRRAFGFADPPVGFERLVTLALRLRGRAAHLLFPRRRPRLRTRMTHRSYPDGYRIESIGPSP